MSDEPKDTKAKGKNQKTKMKNQGAGEVMVYGIVGRLECLKAATVYRHVDSLPQGYEDLYTPSHRRQARDL
jgi:hypothetical protein